jgi:serine/threonine protein kinase
MISLTNDPKFSRGGSLTLHISPVGFCGKIPENLEEMKHAGRSVLSALDWLHKHHWVHRDVRPSNIMFANGEWYLMDLEWANKMNSPIGAYTPNHEYLPPELNRAKEGIWTAACDMWQFGKVLLIWGHRGEFSDDYLWSQCAEKPERRLSASQSLLHNFFALQEEETTLA